MFRTWLSFLLIAGLVAAVTEKKDDEMEILNKPPDELWEYYKEQFDKKYSTPEEDAHRKEIVLGKYRILQEQLELQKKNQIIHTINISKYSDLSHKEFMEKMFGPDNDKNAMYLTFNEPIEASISTRLSGNSFLFTVIILVLTF